MNAKILSIVALALFLFASTAQAQFGLKKPKVKIDKDAVAAESQKKMINQTKDEANKQLSVFTEAFKGFSFDTPVFDLSKIAEAADAQLKALTEQQAKVMKVVDDIKKKKENLQKAIDEVKKSAEKKKDEAKAEAEKTIAELEGLAAKLASTETIAAQFAERLKGWEAEIGEFKGLAEKVAAAAAKSAEDIKGSAAKAGLSVE